jgi:hypothetical protein
MAKKPIKRIIVIFRSPDERNYGFRYVRCSDGRMVDGLITGGESNIMAALTRDHKKDVWRDDYFYTYSKMLERELFALPYAGCDPHDIWNFVERHLRPRRGRSYR